MRLHPDFIRRGVPTSDESWRYPGHKDRFEAVRKRVQSHPDFFEGGDARLVEKVCVVCGKKFVASTVKCSVRKTCSNTCYSRWCAARRAERRTDSGSVTV